MCKSDRLVKFEVRFPAEYSIFSFVYRRIYPKFVNSNDTGYSGVDFGFLLPLKRLPFSAD